MPGKKIARWTTGAIMTFGQIQSAIQYDTGIAVSVDDLCQLNAFLCNRPAVAAGVVIRYYRDA